MKQIRNNVFETNSSSVHSITMCMKSDYDNWIKGNVWYYDCNLPEGKTPFFTWDEVIKFLTFNKVPREEIVELSALKERNEMEEIEDILADHDFYSFDSYICYNEEYEHFHSEFTTPEKETVVSFGYHGDNY